MEIQYLRVTDKHFMILKKVNENFPLYEIEMFTHNKMKWLLPYSMVVADGEMEFWYDITSLQSLEVWFHLQNIKIEQLETLFDSIIDSYCESWEYLLEEESLLMQPSFVFTEIETNKHWFCYLPGHHGKETQPLKNFMETILTMIDYQNKETVAYLYRLYELFQHTKGSFTDLKTCMTAIRSERTTIEIIQETTIEKALVNDDFVKKTIVERIQQFMKQSLEAGKEHGKKKWKTWSDFSIHKKPPLWKEKVEKKEEDTMVVMDLDQGFGVVGELLYLGEQNLPSIEVKKSKTTIGNNEKLADVVIEEVTISKLHALIEYIGGEYFLEDLNSVYGTFLNGQRLSYHERKKLYTDDVVHFAKVKYRFH